ncbi:MAG: hypothetical protein IJM17_09730 [Firmicutes bacterium]|nr:hypothetical protein [Bacillota bacterium]
MKQFLVLAAILPLMLVFFLQFALDRQNSSRIAVLNDLVSSAKEEARQQGCFTAEIKGRLTSSISSSLGIDPEDILIEATESPKYRIMYAEGVSPKDMERGLIYYRVTVPIGKMMAGRALFGLKEDANTYWYTVEGRAASERLRR